QQFVTSLEHSWNTGSRWKGVTRPYAAADVYRLRGSIDIEYSLARFGAARLWQLFQDEEYVAVLSAITGNQAIQQVQAGLKAIYVSGWQVAASEFITKLVAARLATDVCGVDTILIARTDANSATLLTTDCDEYDQCFVTGERTAEGFFRVRDGVEAAIARALAYAPYADL